MKQLNIIVTFLLFPYVIVRTSEQISKINSDEEDPQYSNLYNKFNYNNNNNNNNNNQNINQNINNNNQNRKPTYQLFNNEDENSDEDLFDPLNQQIGSVINEYLLSSRQSSLGNQPSAAAPPPPPPFTTTVAAPSLITNKKNTGDTDDDDEFIQNKYYNNEDDDDDDAHDNDNDEYNNHTDYTITDLENSTIKENSTNATNANFYQEIQQQNNDIQIENINNNNNNVSTNGNKQGKMIIQNNNGLYDRLPAVSFLSRPIIQPNTNVSQEWNAATNQNNQNTNESIQSNLLVPHNETKNDSNDNNGNNANDDADDDDIVVDSIYNEDGNFDEQFLVQQTTQEPKENVPIEVTEKIPQTSTIKIIHRKVYNKPKPPIFKLNADEILRKFIEDSYIRTPLAALIDTSPESLRKAKILWKAALRPNAPLDIVLVAYNSTGVGVTYSFKNTRTMMAGLDSVKDSSIPPSPSPSSSSIDERDTMGPADATNGKFVRNGEGIGGGIAGGNAANSGGSAFFGIMRASELIPYDSAIFISTDTIPNDINLAQYAAITLLKKRIRLYLIWFGPKLTEVNEAFPGHNGEGGILGEVALRSGGEILHVSDEILRPNGDFGLITLLLRNDIQGTHTFPLSIDTTVKNLQIKYQGNIDSSTLETPNVGEIDLVRLPLDVPIHKLTLSSSINEQNRENLDLTEINFVHEIFMNISGLTKECIYKLRFVPTSDTDFYSVSVKIAYNNDDYDDENHPQFVQIPNEDYDFDGKNSIIEQFNEPKSERLISDKQSNAEDDDDDEGIEFDRIPKNTIIFPDEPPQTELMEYNDTAMLERSSLQLITKIELGLQSQLLASPGSTVQIYFEITNLREEPTFHNFQVVDEQRFLRTLSQQSIWLQPSQVTTVVVTAYIPPNIEIGTKDKITLTSQGFGLTSHSAQLTVSTIGGTAQDTRQPSMWWGYGSRCEGKTGAGQCANSVWSVEISTQDTDTGILRVSSNPKGILIRNSFTAGTTQEVKATYTSSCCTTRVTVTSYDLAGNQRSVTLDVTEFILNEASIAAIALGAILLVLLILLVIGLIVWCCHKRKNSRELPVYRSTSRRDERA